MSRWMTGLFLFSLCTYGCQHAQNSQTAAVQEQAVLAKPIVAVVPVIDHSHSELGWNLSEELTHSISARLLKHDQLYLVNPEKVQASVRKLKETQDPFSSNLSWVKRAFSQNEFVVFMELVEHKEYPLHVESDSQDSPAELSIAMRVRVVDIRGAEPKIVLQELLQDSQHIPRQFTRANFDQVPWGADTFDISPVGMAHAQLTKELASRLEDYILLSEQR